jgi:hypothetical protein
MGYARDTLRACGRDEIIVGVKVGPHLAARGGE